MTYPVNLLRWREERRRRCLRFWAMMFIGLWLIALLQILSARMAQTQSSGWQGIRAAADRTLLQALTQREASLTERHQRGAAAQDRALQRTQTLRWSSMLLTLAEQIPAQGWLTALQWQGGSLGLSGATIQFQALSAVERAVRTLPGFAAVQPGPTKQDGQGRWQFSYQLRAGEAHARAR